ncbi:MAG: CPBP family intramembrane metalloprotease [Spirochaetaceae bacterium]|jgi:membrane protease YdiL (CAAX protease family)|nr:CPBP family intramembrane metalloprotease [Spirochaetaceae bacterium]
MDVKIYPGIKNAILLCLLVLGIQFVTGLIIGLLQVILKMSDASLFVGVLTALTSIVSFGIVLLIGFKKAKRTFNGIFKFNNVSPLLWAATILFTTGYVMVSSELDNILNFILPMPEILKDIFETLAAQQIFVFALITMAIIPAFTEELLFRGLILDGLAGNYTKRKAIILSALFFGLIHLNPWQFLTAFCIGLFSAWICINTNSIWPSIYIHLFNNALYTITARFDNLIPIKGFNNNYAIPVEFQPLWFDITGAMVLILGILLLKKGFAARNSGTKFHMKPEYYSAST